MPNDLACPALQPLPTRTFLSWIGRIALVFWLVTLSIVHATANEPSRDPAMDTPEVQGPTVSFDNDIVPVLTKAGCNMGVCHAKAGGGQNGFQLSLLGFEPEEDYEHIVRESRGRRLFLPAPAESLLLRKATGEEAHGGGVRIEAASRDYETLRRWIAEGAPRRLKHPVSLSSIKVEPAAMLLHAGAEQALKVTARYDDGSERDVTRLAIFESNDTAMLHVTNRGQIRALDIPGRASVMVRYQGLPSVATISIPLQGVAPESLVYPPTRNFVDETVFQNLKTLGIPASPVCDDATFLRRVTLDVAGRLPTLEETRSFMEDTTDGRRDAIIDRLLTSVGYADFFANKWTSLLKNRRDAVSDITSNFAFHAWIRDGLLANRPYDQMVRDLLAATGTVIGNPAVAWYKRVKEPKEQIEDVAQLFLGVRMQCAQCHHHPFERWSQTDYYGLTAFFSRVGRKPTATRGEDMIFHERGIAASKNPKNGEMVRPRALGDAVGDISAGQDPRLVLADWLRQDTNPFFAKALVNRYWKHFLGRALVEPEDDLRDTNPASNPELLQALERHFIESGFDLKSLVREITRSSTYQLSSQPVEQNASDHQSYSRFYPKRLQAEVMLDAIDDVTGASTSFANLPIGTRAVALPDNSYNKSSPFLTVFGRPEGNSVCECERVQSASLGQSLHLLNAKDIQQKIASSKGRVATMAQEESAEEETISQLYQAAFSRLPSEEEHAVGSAYLSEPRLSKDGKPLDEKASRRENLQDLVWALINTKEFLFNH